MKRGLSFCHISGELLYEFTTPFVAHVASRNDDDVDNPPDTKSATGYELEEAGSPFADEHAVDAQCADEDGKN